MVAAHDSKSCLERGVSSSLTPGTSEAYVRSILHCCSMRVRLEGRRYIFVCASQGKNTEPGSRKFSVKKIICDRSLMFGHL